MQSLSDLDLSCEYRESDYSMPGAILWDTCGPVDWDLLKTDESSSLLFTQTPWHYTSTINFGVAESSLGRSQTIWPNNVSIFHPDTLDFEWDSSPTIFPRDLLQSFNLDDSPASDTLLSHDSTSTVTSLFYESMNEIGSEGGSSRASTPALTMSLPSSRSSSCSPSTDLSFDLPSETLDATKVPTGTRVLELAASFQFGSSMGFDFDSSFLRASSSPLILAPSPETHTVPLNSEDQHACPDKTCGPSQSPAPSCHRSPKVKNKGRKPRCQSSDEDYEDADDSEEDDYDPHGCNSATGRKRKSPYASQTLEERSCTQCKIVFTRSADLMRHTWSAHSMMSEGMRQESTCVLCLKILARPDAMKRHMETRTKKCSSKAKQRLDCGDLDPEVFKLWYPL